MGLITGETPKEDVQHEHQAKESSDVWYIREGVPGEGPRPDWLLPKYNNMEVQAKSYPELMKVKSIDVQVPESYQLESVSEIFDLNNPHISAIAAKAKSHKLSQDALSDIVSEFAEYQKSLMPNVDEEIKKLGNNAQQRLDTVNTWATNHLSKKAVETLGKISYTADVVEMLDEIRQIHHGMSSRIPVGQNVEPVKIESVAEIDNEMAANYSRYKTDAVYRNNLNKRRAQALGED